ncbi:hypothetical protein R6Q57_011737 [Mikania cordata]
MVDTIDPQIQQQQVGPMGFVDMIEQGDQIELQETQIAFTSVTKIPSPKFVDLEIDIALEKIKKRPQAIQNISKMLADYVGMNMLSYLFSNYWLDVTIIHLFAMSFFGMTNSKSAIFNPNEISGDKCVKSPDRVKQHLLNVYSFHSERTFFLAPYIARYIVDSINKHKSNQNYAFTYLIEEAFGVKLKWEVVKCAQQRKTWECGFCVVKHMYEFLNLYQHDFPKTIWNESKYITSKEIDGMIINLAPQFFKHVFANRT